MIESGAAEVVALSPTSDYGKQLMAATPRLAGAMPPLPEPGAALLEVCHINVRFKKPGQISGDGWKTTLTKFEKGEQPVVHNVGYRGNTVLGSQSGASYPAGCTACQRKAMGL